MASGAQSPATKQDIRLLMEQMGGIHERMDTLVDEKKLQAAMARQEKRILKETKEYFDFYTGKLHKDLLGATKDELQILKDTDANHDVRITKLEQQASLAVA